MTLRLTDAESAEIAAAAEREGTSMQKFIVESALQAARQRVQRRDQLIAALAAERRDVLDRLGKV